MPLQAALSSAQDLKRTQDSKNQQLLNLMLDLNSDLNHSHNLNSTQTRTQPPPQHQFQTKPKRQLYASHPVRICSRRPSQNPSAFEYATVNVMPFARLQIRTQHIGNPIGFGFRR